MIDKWIDARACAGCDFISPTPYTATRSAEFYRCARPGSKGREVFNPVSGDKWKEHPKCVDERSENGSCGIEGEFFSGSKRLEFLDKYEKCMAEREARAKEDAPKKGFFNTLFHAYKMGVEI